MKGPRFLYHAEATGISGRITQPFDKTIEVQAPSALPPAGGFSSNCARNFELCGLVSYRELRTVVSGTFVERTESHETAASATIEGLNINDVVRAEIITARITSVHSATQDRQPNITPIGSHFEGLRIAGRTIELQSNVSRYAELDTLQALRERYDKDNTFRDTLNEELQRGKEDKLEERKRIFFPWRRCKKNDFPEYHGVTIVPLFTVKNKSEPGFTVVGNVIHVANFGHIHLGELVISAYERRLTMIDVYLGSPFEGRISGGGVGGNGGQTEPP